MPFGKNPTFVKDDANLLKTNVKESFVSDPNLQKSRTSMSQLKLSRLVNNNSTVEAILEDYSLKELRDNFFDPVYLKPTNPTLSVSEREKSKWKINLNTYINAFSTQKLKEYCNNWIIITKFTLAYFISIVLCLIHPTGSWFGRFRLFIPIATLIHHPIHDIGTQIEITIQSIMGLAIGLGWSSLALYLSTVSRSTRNHQGGILAGSLFVGLFMMGWFKAYYSRFYYMLLTSGLVLIFLSTSLELNDLTVKWKNCWNIGIPYLFGLLVSLVVSLVYFPCLSHRKLIRSILSTTGSIKSLLVKFTTIDRTDDPQVIFDLQGSAINEMILLSENFREFLSGLRLSSFEDEDLKSIRNYLNFIISPLRVIPAKTNIYFKDSDKNVGVSSNCNTKVCNTDSLNSPMVSGIATPLPKAYINLSLHPKFNMGTQIVYMSIMNEAFNTPLYKLLIEMIENIKEFEALIMSLSDVTTSETEKQKLSNSIEKSKLLLKKRIYQLDITYRKFSKSEYFCRDLLNEESVINIFLFLRYSRQTATMLVHLSDVILTTKNNVSRWYKPTMPKYPILRALRRLPVQCLRDQGADLTFHYFETKIDVDDAFERIYNLNTSRKKSVKEKDKKVIRAIDHNDFNFHSTKNPIRFKLCKLSNRINDFETKYAFKVSFVIIFLALPSWLKASWRWYYDYNCYWSPLLVYYFLSPRNSGTWFNLWTRIVCWLIGSFWGWAANIARNYSGGYVIAVFSVLISFVFSYFFLIQKHPRSSFIALLSFTIISLHGYVKAEENSGKVFKHSWTTSIAILVSIIASMFTNWLFWPFIARNELFRSLSSLLSHISQSYQSVSERYLYRDNRDDPTDLTLELANIREVRMSQSLVAVKELLQRARKEHDFTHTFQPQIFDQLLNSCHLMLEKIIEARMSGVYLNVWELDHDEETTKELLATRRDSVASVIYVLYIISNSIRTKSKIPRYLPSALSTRKKLYSLIVELELKRKATTEPRNIMNQLIERLEKIDTENMEHDDKSYMKSHWTEVHGMAYSRAVTSITEELDNIIKLAKELLGEESYLE